VSIVSGALAVGPGNAALSILGGGIAPATPVALPSARSRAFAIAPAAAKLARTSAGDRLRRAPVRLGRKSSYLAFLLPANRQIRIHRPACRWSSTEGSLIRS
jgi:hypothetical protein